MSDGEKVMEDLLRVLVIGASQLYSTKEYLDREEDIIKKAYENCSFTSVITKVATTYKREKILDLINTFKPKIIHFTAHGGPATHIEMEASDGNIVRLTGEAILKNLNRHDINVDCVFFSNCSLYRGIKKISSRIKYTVGARLNNKTFDVSNMLSSLFYEELSKDNSFSSAYNSVKHSLLNKYEKINLKLNYFENVDKDGGSPIFKEDLVFYQTRLPEDPINKVLPKNKNAIPESNGENKGKSVDSSTVKLEHNLKEYISKDRQEVITKINLKIKAKQIKLESEKDDRSRLYKVWFGTNRVPLDNDDLSKGFSAYRNDSISYGYCNVTIPKHHTIGSIGDPWWKRLPIFWKDNKLKVIDRFVLEYEAYFSELQEYYKSISKDKKNLLIFIHGYNVTFDNAAIRAAQLGFDLGISGTTAFFSWPSQGTIAGYPADIATIEASEKHIGNFIENMTNQSGAQKVHIIAHSMGNRGLLRAYSRLFDKVQEKTSKPFDQIFLAAPDVDVDLFKDLAGVFNKVSKKTTMYVSEEDMALMSSGIIHKAPRAGYTPPVTIVNGIDTIEVTDIDLTFLGHGYVADARPVLEDMHSLMLNNNSPDSRFALDEVKLATGEIYWKMKK